MQAKRLSRRRPAKERCWKQKIWFGSTFFCVLYIWATHKTKKRLNQTISIYELAMFDWTVFFNIFELLWCCRWWVRANEWLPYFFAVSLPSGFCRFTLRSSSSLILACFGNLFSFRLLSCWEYCLEAKKSF